jgi:carboxylesterase
VTDGVAATGIDVVLVHGLGGTAATMRALADALERDGWAVATPMLPGHGTDPTALIGVTWEQWLAAVPAAAVVIGQSLGGSLALAAAAQGSATAGVVCINAIGEADPAALEALEADVRAGVEWVDSGPPDIRAPDATEEAYDRLPLSALLAMTRGVASTDLATITVPVLVVTSADDAVVDPAHSDVIARSVRGPVERLRLARSGHVATLDLDAPMLVDATREFVSRALSRRR